MITIRPNEALLCRRGHQVTFALWTGTEWQDATAHSNIPPQTHVADHGSRTWKRIAYPEHQVELL